MFIDNVLKYASKCYGFDVNNASWVNSGSNKIYKIQKNGENFYLRISTRKIEYILAENDWINFLRDGVKVPVLTKSNNNKSIELYQEDGVTYVICLFYELPGVYWNKNNTETWNETVFKNWGSTMGKMHRMTKNYQPPESYVKRPLFEDNLIPLEHYEAVPSVYVKMAHIQREILELPRNIDSYGLIHSDLAQQNILIHNNEISVLDFDDCQYGFFALDIGIALYHAIWWGLPEDNSLKNNFAFTIIKNFMSGYETENILSDYWLKKIVLFMRYRQISALKWHLGYYKPKCLNEVVYNDYFKIYYNFGTSIKFIENDIFYDDCNIVEDDFVNITK